jgi:putative ABC transport system permease protein
MIRHLFKLVWNRKRTNALIILEIFFAFFVVCVVGTMALFYWDNIRQPLGFSYQDVWTVQINAHQDSEQYDPVQVRSFQRLLAETRALAPVESVAGVMIVPYSTSDFTGGWKLNGRQLDIAFNEVTEDFARVMGLELVQGRWFERADESLAWRPVVINERLAREAYGDASPIGQRFGEPGKDKEHPEPEKRVIGVLREFKKGGELAAVTNYAFQLKRLNVEPKSAEATREDRPPGNLVIKVRPGTPIAFQEELMKRMQAVAPDWSFEMGTLEEMRTSASRIRLAPLVAGSIEALFLLLMVALGLIGVLWQNLLQRTREMGLRRAAGASRSNVHAQVLLEQMILTSFGVLLGTLLVIQVPLLDLIGFIRPRIILGGILVAMIAIYLLAALCALYPSLMASRVQPAEALRYE